MKHYSVYFAVNYSINLGYSTISIKQSIYSSCLYFQRVIGLEGNQAPHEMIYIDEASFNLAKKCWRGRHVIGKWATITVPGQRVNITICAAISNSGVVLHKCEIGPFNTNRLLLFLEELHDRLVPEADRGLPTCEVVRDNVAFHRSQHGLMPIPEWCICFFLLIPLPQPH